MVKDKRRRYGSYTSRLYKGKLRRFYHESRYRFLKHVTEKYNLQTSHVLEIGCNDAKTLEYIKPLSYLCIDADCEAMAIAREEYGHIPDYKFLLASDLNEAKTTLFKDRFDLAISMETFEHFDKETLHYYMNLFKSTVTGLILITVPVEIGPLFLVKHLIKRFIYRDCVELKLYKPLEVINAALLRPEKVQRVMGGHKGFDYREIIREVQQFFSIVEICGIPFNLRPLFLNPTIGIVAKN